MARFSHGRPHASEPAIRVTLACVAQVDAAPLRYNGAGLTEMPHTKFVHALNEQIVFPPRCMRARFAWRALWLVAFLAGTTAPACGDSANDLTVFAAISLRGPLDEIASAFEEQHPDADIAFNFAGSQFLRFQLEQGAPADVFVSADGRQMELVGESQLVEGDSIVFARNRLVVAIADGNPGGVETIEDLGSPGLRLVWAAETVPLGAYSRETLSALAVTFGTDFPRQVEANVVSEEQNAEAVAGKVELGEADAAIIYETDAPRLEREGATIIPVPNAYQPDIRYLAAALKTAGNQDFSRAFVEFLVSEDGQRILIEHGFFGVR